MNKTAPEIIQLRLDIEQSVHRQMVTPYDFDFLTSAIWERCHANLSPSTLKRIWGYVNGVAMPRLSTLNILAQFLGYDSWKTYKQEIKQRSGIESEVLFAEGIKSDDLEAGDKVKVEWLPNRKCVFRYQGNHHFEVIESENSKLQVGATFTCSFFLLHQPLYLDELQQSGGEPVSYVAGKQQGLTKVEKL